MFTWPSEEPQLLVAAANLLSGHVPAAAVLCPPGRSTSPHAAPAGRVVDLHAGFLPRALRQRQDHETFRPYGVRMVQLGDEVKVEARLTENDPSALRIGMDVELVVVPVPGRPRQHRDHDLRIRAG